MKIGICGICGRMGVAVLKIILERGHQLGAAFDSESIPSFGADAGTLINADALGVSITGVNEEAFSGLDGVIDFSSPVATGSLIRAAVGQGTPLVIGTTGLNDKQRAQISSASKDIAILFSPNMSVGVNLLFKLAEIASQVLGSEYDVELFEAHHRFKKDAPSGTAKRLLEIVKDSRKDLAEASEIAGREGITGERSDNEIGVLAMRGGDIVGEHTLYFCAPGERIELTHRASSREILARGAVSALEFLSGKPAGSYTMFDVLGIS